MALYTVASGGTIQANSDVNQVVTALNGTAATPLTLAGAATLAGGVSGVLAATGAVTANNNRCVEGSQDVTHVEVYPPQGSQNVGAGSAATVTFTFRRPFSGAPACVGSCQSGGADAANVAAGKIVSFQTNGQGQYTAVTMGFRNLDPNPQPMSNFCVIAAGV